LLSAGLATALVSQSVQGTITPWVVEVDHVGQTQAVAPANPFYKPTDPQIAFHSHASSKMSARNRECFTPCSI
jgi:type IV secretion system protein VirB5